MIFRLDENTGKLYQINIPPEDEDIFLEIQKKGKLKYLKLSPSDLPLSPYPFYRYDEDGTIVPDLDRIKPEEVKKLNNNAKGHILSKLRSLDWGDSYEECLAELNSSAEVLEAKILYLLKPHKPDLALTEIRQKIAEYLAGTYSAEDAQRELQELGLSEEEIHKYLSLLGYAVEVAKLLYWVEEVWDYVEQKEKEINQASTLEELEQIEIRFPELE